MWHVHADISPNVAALTDNVARDLELQQATALWLPRYGGCSRITGLDTQLVSSLILWEEPIAPRA